MEENIMGKEKPYQFRALCAKDIPLVTNVIKAIGLKEFKSCLNKDVIDGIVKMFDKKEPEGKAEKNESDTLIAVGLSFFPSLLDIAEIILNNIDKCEAALFKLLSKTSNLSEQEVENLSLSDFAEMVFDFVKKDEFPDFFKVVLKFVKPAK